jgi:hypothetical protein
MNSSIRSRILPGIFLIALVIFPITYLGIRTAVDAQSKPVLVFAPGDYCLWYEDSLTRVDKSSPISPRQSAMDPQVSIRAARNEYESFQVVFRSVNESQYFYRQFQLVFSNLQPDLDSSTPGNTTIASTNFQWFKVEYVMDDVDNGYADLLRAGSSFSIVLRENHPFWIDLYVPSNAGAGDYISTVQVKLKDRPTQEFQIKLHVYNFTIPDRHSIVNTMGNARVQEKIDMLQARRISPYHVTTFSYQRNDTYIGPGFNYTFDWTEFDLLTEQAITRQLDSFRIDFWDGSHPEFSTEFNATMINWFRQVGTHLAANGWLELGYVYIIDEPPANQLYRVKQAFDLVHEAHPGLRTMITTNPSDRSLPILEDCVDIWCPPVHEYDVEIVQALQAKGKIVWAYPCLYPKVPYFNFMIHNLPQDPRLYYWKTYYDGLNGCLYWSVDYYHYSHGGYGYNGMGDGILIYEISGGKWAPSIRLNSIRDGIEDLEYFKLYDQRFQNSADAQYLAYRATIENFLDLSGNERFDRTAMLDFRQQIAEKLST